LSGPRLSIIPAGAVTDRSLEPRDLQVLCLLGRHTDKAGWCVRSQVKMAGELDCSRSSVQRSLDRLYEAGWVEKKRRDIAMGASDAGQPSASYAYRVVLDRDDFAFETAIRGAEEETDESYAETASEEGGCPPVGTPSGTNSGTNSDAPAGPEKAAEGAHTDGHPGAQPYVGTGAQPYVGTKNVPLERSHLERERDARARDRRARFLVSFEARWPTAAADDRQRTAYAAGALSEAEEQAALAGIGPFLENLKRLKRSNVPAGWNYLEQRRWTLLEAQKAAGVAVAAVFARDTVEAKALAVLHEIAGAGDGFRKIYRSPDGSISYRLPMTPQLMALAQAAPQTEWVALNRNQAGAWEGLLRDAVTIVIRKHLKEGERAPWPWPPSAEGKVYSSATGPPDTLMSEQDEADFANEGTR
jgi:DNA-binding transcriptional ArsR family regulator